MLVVPLQAVPNQFVQVTLNNQACSIHVYQKFWGLFCDLLVNQQPIIQSVLCLNANYIVRSLYLGFNGDLAFWDTQGQGFPSFTGADPNYTELGSRFQLLYLAPSDLPSTYGQSQFNL